LAAQQLSGINARSLFWGSLTDLSSFENHVAHEMVDEPFVGDTISGVFASVRRSGDRRIADLALLEEDL
jgi:hypothetical protein